MMVHELRQNQKSAPYRGEGRARLPPSLMGQGLCWAMAPDLLRFDLIWSKSRRFGCLHLRTIE